MNWIKNPPQIEDLYPGDKDWFWNLMVMNRPNYDCGLVKNGLDFGLFQTGHCDQDDDSVQISRKDLNSLYTELDLEMKSLLDLK